MKQRFSLTRFCRARTVSRNFLPDWSCFSSLHLTLASNPRVFPVAAEFLLREMEHGVPQEQIRFSLIAGAIGPKPCNDIDVQADGYRPLFRAVEFADFCPAPVNDGPDIGKINVRVFFRRDGGGVAFLVLCELLHRPSFRAIPRHERK